MIYNPAPSLHSHYEVDKIIEICNGLSENSIIVEVGTFLGGTANLIHNNVHDSAKIYSIDINQDVLETKDKLHGKNIYFLDGTSDSIAARWNSPIDFLFIDGGHRLIDTLNDFNAWSANLNNETTIAFHDYDETIAGGVYYIGVKIVVDTVMRKGMLYNIEHNTTLLTGTANVDFMRPINLDDLLETISINIVEINSTIEYLSDRLRDWFLNGCQGKASILFEDAPELHFPSNSINIGKHPICYKFNQLIFTYMFHEWIKKHTDDAMKISGRPDIGLYLEMMLWLDAERRMTYPNKCAFDDIFGTSFYPRSIASYGLTSVEDLGRFMTLEQVRLNMLSRITNPIFDIIVNNW